MGCSKVGGHVGRRFAGNDGSQFPFSGKEREIAQLKRHGLSQFWARKTSERLVNGLKEAGRRRISVVVPIAARGRDHFQVAQERVAFWSHADIADRLERQDPPQVRAHYFLLRSLRTVVL